LNILHSDESPKTSDGLPVFTQSIFLAGPTPRKPDVPSWRPTAIKILEESGFEGTVLVPERKDGYVKGCYDDQVEWEKYCLSKASVIVFWVPRNMENMPALTTNIEFGYWIAKTPERVVYGRPPEAPSTRYLDWLLREEQSDPVIYSDLKSLLLAAIEIAEETDDEFVSLSRALREAGER
jgi:hypothetical protein